MHQGCIRVPRGEPETELSLRTDGSRGGVTQTGSVSSKHRSL